VSPDGGAFAWPSAKCEASRLIGARLHSYPESLTGHPPRIELQHLTARSGAMKIDVVRDLRTEDCANALLEHDLLYYFATAKNSSKA